MAVRSASSRGHSLSCGAGLRHVRNVGARDRPSRCRARTIADRSLVARMAGTGEGRRLRRAGRKRAPASAGRRVGRHFAGTHMVWRRCWADHSGRELSNSRRGRGRSLKAERKRANRRHYPPASGWRTPTVEDAGQSPWAVRSAHQRPAQERWCVRMRGARGRGPLQARRRELSGRIVWSACRFHGASFAVALATGGVVGRTGP